MRILPVLILVVIVSSTNAQNSVLLTAGQSLAQYTIISTGTSDDLTSISKINNNILINGYSTYLAKSYDNCNTLIPVNTPVFLDNPLYRYFGTLRLDTNNIYLSYSYGNNWKFYKSVNGGNSWIKKQDSTHTNLNTVHPTPLFFDTINGSVMFDYNRAIYTSNGLTTYTVGWWTSGGWMLSENGAGAVLFGDSIAIFGENTYGGAYMTKNRGKTWQSELVAGQPRDFEVINKDTIYYISSPTSFGNVGFFGYTFNGGQTWPYKTISEPTYFLNICVKNKNEIYLLAREGASATGNGVILKTTNLGQTFTKYTTPFIASLRDMKFLNDSIALICGDGGLLFKLNTKTAVYVGVKENNLDELPINIYPNPTNGIININLQNIKQPITVNITNTLGQSVYQSEINSQQPTVNISTFTKGIYFLKVYSNNNYKTFKIIKN